MNAMMQAVFLVLLGFPAGGTSTNRLRVTKISVKDTGMTVMWHGPEEVNSYVVSWTGTKQFTNERGIQTNYSVTDYVTVGGSEYKVLITQLLPSVQYLVLVSGIIHSSRQRARVVDSMPVIVQTKRGDIAQAPMPKTLSRGSYGSFVAVSLSPASDKTAHISKYELVLRDVSDRESVSGFSDAVIAAFEPAASLPKRYKIQAVSETGQIQLKEHHAYRAAVRAVVIDRCNTFSRIGHFSETFSAKELSSSSQDHPADGKTNTQRANTHKSKLPSPTKDTSPLKHKETDEIPSVFTAKSGSSGNTIIILAVAGVTGVILIIAAVACGVCCCIRKRRNKKRRRARSDSLWYDPIQGKRQELPEIPKLPKKSEDRNENNVITEDLQDESRAPQLQTDVKKPGRSRRRKARLSNPEAENPRENAGERFPDAKTRKNFPDHHQLSTTSRPSRPPPPVSLASSENTSSRIAPSEIRQREKDRRKSRPVVSIPPPPPPPPLQRVRSSVSGNNPLPPPPPPPPPPPLSSRTISRQL